MSKVLQERGFRSLPSAIETNLRDHVKSISTIVEADLYLIHSMGSSQYVVSTGQNRTLMYETKHTIIMFPSCLNGYYCEEKKGSYGLQFSKAYSEASHINNSIPIKEKDPRSFTLPCFINNVCFCNALDLGASVSVMPLSTYLNLGLGELAHTKLTIELADRIVKYPKRIAENVLVEDYSEEEVTEAIAKTMKQYMSKTRADYGSGVARPKIEDKDHFELKGQFLKELRENTFSGSNHEDANEHIEKVLEIEVILFYNGLEVPTRQILDSRGAIPTKTVVDAKTRSTETFDGLAAIQAQLNNLRREIKKANEKVYAAQVGCEQCKGHHYTKDCPNKEEWTTLEEDYYTQFGGPFQGGGYRAAAPGFYQRNNANPSNQGTSIKTLDIQIGQMSKVLQERGFGNLPSSTEANSRDQVKSISTTIEVDSYPIRHIGSSQYAVSTGQNRTLMYETRQTTIPFPSRLNGYYCEEKRDHMDHNSRKLTLKLHISIIPYPERRKT
ncbi:hypothetical protein Tco_0086320 [Tanacetum coccineum]